MSKEQIKRLVINFICGVAIGGGAILPGISGGVLCVVFGVYKPLMEVVSEPKTGVKKYWKMLLPIGFGWLAGFILFSNLIKLMFGASEIYAIWLFVGLIFGNIPALYKEAGKEGRNTKCFIAAGIGYVVMYSLLLLIMALPGINIEANIFWYLFAGVMWGLSLIIPGFTSSSLLISLGIFEEFNAGLSVVNPSVVIPWVLGIIGSVVLLGRAINYFIKKHYAVCFHTVIGIVIASTLIIVPLDNPYSVKQIIFSVVFAAIGFVTAYFSDNIKVK